MHCVVRFQTHVNDGVCSANMHCIFVACNSSHCFHHELIFLFSLMWCKKIPPNQCLFSLIGLFYPELRTAVVAEKKASSVEDCPLW